MSILGQGAINVAGHKISYGLLAAGAGIVGAVLLFIQMRNAGSSIGAGSSSGTYTDAQGNVYDANGNLVSAGSLAGASGSDWQSAFSALSSQISALSGGSTANPTPKPPVSPGAAAAGAGYASYHTQWGNTGAATGQPGAPAAHDPMPVTTHVATPRGPIYPTGPGIDSTAYPGTLVVTVPGSSIPGQPAYRKTDDRKYVIDVNTPVIKPFNPILGRTSGNQATT